MPTLTTTFTTFSTEARAGSIGGTESWGTAANAQTDDGAYATYGTNSPQPWNGYTLYLTAKELTDEVPAGATIDGIEIVLGCGEVSAGVGDWKDSAVYIIKGGTIQTTQNKASASVYTAYPTESVLSHGGAADLWGQTWTAADINAAGFGVAISCVQSGADETGASVQVDYIQVSVTYTEAVTTTVTPPAATLALSGKSAVAGFGFVPGKLALALTTYAPSLIGPTGGSQSGMMMTGVG